MTKEKKRTIYGFLLNLGEDIGVFRERVILRIINADNISGKWKTDLISNADQKLKKIKDAIINFGDHELCLKNMIELVNLSGNDELIKYLRKEKNKEDSDYINFGDDGLNSKFMAVLSNITRDMDFGTDDINYVLSENLSYLSVVFSNIERSIQPHESESIEIHDSTENNELDPEAKSMMNESLFSQDNVVSTLSLRMREIIIDKVKHNVSIMNSGYNPTCYKETAEIIDFYYENIMTLSMLTTSKGSIKNHAEGVVEKASMSIGIEISDQLDDAVKKIFNAANDQLQSRSSLPSM